MTLETMVVGGWTYVSYHAARLIAVYSNLARWYGTWRYFGLTKGTSLGEPLNVVISAQRWGRN